MTDAQFALLLASLIGSTASVIVAAVAWWRSSAAAKRHSTSWLRAELDELTSVVTTHSRLIKQQHARLATYARESAPARADTADSDSLPTDRVALKNALRAKVGLVPGKPAPHA